MNDTGLPAGAGDTPVPTGERATRRLLGFRPDSGALLGEAEAERALGVETPVGMDPREIPLPEDEMAASFKLASAIVNGSFAEDIVAAQIELHKAVEEGPRNANLARLAAGVRADLAKTEPYRPDPSTVTRDRSRPQAPLPPADGIESKGGHFSKRDMLVNPLILFAPDAFRVTNSSKELVDPKLRFNLVPRPPLDAMDYGLKDLVHGRTGGRGGRYPVLREALLENFRPKDPFELPSASSVSHKYLVRLLAFLHGEEGKGVSMTRFTANDIAGRESIRLNGMETLSSSMEGAAGAAVGKAALAEILAGAGGEVVPERIQISVSAQDLNLDIDRLSADDESREVGTRSIVARMPDNFFEQEGYMSRLEGIYTVRRPSPSGKGDKLTALAFLETTREPSVFVGDKELGKGEIDVLERNFNKLNGAKLPGSKFRSKDGVLFQERHRNSDHVGLPTIIIHASDAQHGSGAGSSTSVSLTDALVNGERGADPESSQRVKIPSGAVSLIPGSSSTATMDQAPVSALEVQVVNRRPKPYSIKLKYGAWGNLPLQIQEDGSLRVIDLGAEARVAKREYPVADVEIYNRRNLKLRELDGVPLMPSHIARIVPKSGHRSKIYPFFGSLALRAHDPGAVKGGAYYKLKPGRGVS